MGRYMVMNGDLTWGGEHIINSVQIMYCAPETCIILLTSVTPTHFIEKIKRDMMCRTNLDSSQKIFL